MEKISKRFEKLLIQEGISQSDFSKISGISDRTVSNILSGKTEKPKLDFFASIANHFPKYLFWIITGINEPGELGKTNHVSNSDREKEMLHLIGKQQLEIERLKRLVK